MSYRLLEGDVLARLRDLPADSVHCVVTSPPYWGLRDYGVDGQIGLEPTFDEFLAKLVEVFREVRRVLRPDGTCWVNMGDAYANDPGNGRGSDERAGLANGGATPHRSGMNKLGGAWKRKDLIGQPWELAFALRRDGWWLRQDIIWHKPNPMPESVTDRCTKAHEYIFLLTKSERYFYDAEAVKESVTGNAHSRTGVGFGHAFDDEPKPRVGGLNPKAAGVNSRFNVSRDHGHSTRPKQNSSYSAAITELVGSRNKRSVWTIATEAFPQAHFATFPTELVKPCILAGTSERGCCEACGAPYTRKLEDTPEYAAFKRSENERKGAGNGGMRSNNLAALGLTAGTGNKSVSAQAVTVGWGASCGCSAGVTSCTVLDIFNGSGTTGVVAQRLGREYIGIELKSEYVAIARRRLDHFHTTPPRQARGEAHEYAPLFAQEAGAA